MAGMEEKLADLVDDHNFRLIDRQLSLFNLFEAIGAIRGELRHSEFLSFLLSPTRNHSLGSEFLIQFIRVALGKTPHEKRPINSLELLVSDLDDAIVYREQDNIDLLIELPAIKLVVVIENKIGAAVGNGQLARYKLASKLRYPDHRHLFVLLTPDGIEPDEDDYVGLSYSDVAYLVELLANRTDRVSQDVTIILNHYIEMLRRHIVEDEKLNALVRQLYVRHKDAFDFVFEKRPQPDSLFEGARSLLTDDLTLIEDRHSPSILRFVPASWTSEPLFNDCPEERWTHTKRNLIFELKWNRETDRVIIALVSGPADPSLRKKLYAFAVDRPKTFIGLVKPMGAKTATIFQRELISATLAASLETGEKLEALNAKLKEFLDNELKEIVAELTSFRMKI